MEYKLYNTVKYIGWIYTYKEVNYNIEEVKTVIYIFTFNNSINNTKNILAYLYFSHLKIM